MSDPAQIEEHVRRIATDGYTVVADAIEPELVAALAADLERLERELEIVPAQNRFEGRQTLRVYNLLVHGELYQRIPVHPRVLPIVERVLDPGCLISSLSSIAILPGEKPQPIHADDLLIPLPKPHIATVCNTMWAITDFTAENGATLVVPGSHQLDRSPGYREPCDARPAVMSKGSVLVNHGSLCHGGGANTTTGRRTGIAMNYCAGFIRQQENQQLGIPREVAAGFSPRLPELVGYGLYAGVIGHVNRTHPSALLDGAFDPRRPGKLFDPG